MNVLYSRFTPIDDSDPSCNHTWVTLCVYNIDPDLVTQKLGITPTIRQKKGAPSVVPSGREIIGRVNSWLLSSKNYVSSKDVRTHLDWLLDKVEPVTTELKELQQLPSAQTVIRCSWFSVEENGGTLALWPEQMGRMAKANLEFLLTFISNDGDETEEAGGD